MGENDQSIEEILEELAKVDPEFVARIADLDWDELMDDVMKQAMEAAAKESNCRVARHYGGSHYARQIAGLNNSARCIGAFRNQHGSEAPEMGVYIQDHRVALVWDREDEIHKSTLDEWSATLQRCYTECTMAAIMQIFSADGEVERSDIGDGSVMFSTKLREAV